MKSIFTYLLLSTLLVASAEAERPSVRSEVPRQTIGNISYYVVPETKQIWLELPYRLKGTIISAGDVHNLSIFAQADKSLDRDEVAKLRKQYPGYKLREAAILGKDRVEIDLGISKRITLAEDPSGHAGFFSAEVLLTNAEAQALKNKIRAQELPVMQLVVKRSVPFERIYDSFSLPTKRICQQLVQASGNQPVRFARGLSLLYSTLLPEIKGLRGGIAEQAVERVVETCLLTEDDPESKLGRVPVSFTSRNAKETDFLKMSTIEEISASVDAVVESEWSIL